MEQDLFDPYPEIISPVKVHLLQVIEQKTESDGVLLPLGGIALGFASLFFTRLDIKELEQKPFLHEKRIRNYLAKMELQNLVFKQVRKEGIPKRRVIYYAINYNTVAHLFCRYWTINYIEKHEIASWRNGALSKCVDAAIAMYLQKTEEQWREDIRQESYQRQEKIGKRANAFLEAQHILEQACLRNKISFKKVMRDYKRYGHRYIHILNRHILAIQPLVKAIEEKIPPIKKPEREIYERIFKPKTIALEWVQKALVGETLQEQIYCKRIMRWYKNLGEDHQKVVGAHIIAHHHVPVSDLFSLLKELDIKGVPLLT